MKTKERIALLDARVSRMEYAIRSMTDRMVSLQSNANMRQLTSRERRQRLRETMEERERFTGGTDL